MPADENNFDFPAYREAFTTQNVDTWISFYAPGAEWVEYRHTNPPRSPNRMTGRSEIKAFLSRVKDSDVSLSITDEVTGPERAAFCVTVVLADGVRRIIEHVIIHYRDGMIYSQVDVEAWD